MTTRPRYFRSPAEFRTWLRKHHGSATELIVGYHKRHTGKPSLTWAESVAEALCFGWIDGIRRRVDENRYTIRFTPRRPESNWSAVNLRLVEQLEAAGKMTPPGRAAFEARREQSPGYSSEQPEVAFDAARKREFQRHHDAWAFFRDQPPGYRKKITLWVMSARRDETRDRRLTKLIESCKRGVRP